MAKRRVGGRAPAVRSVGLRKPADIIKEQLGGNRFTTMTGAKRFLATANGLQFTLPSGFAKDKINTVIITLQPNDLYKMEFFNIRGVNVKEVKSTDNIHVAGLKPTFTSITGLDTRL